MVLPEGVLLWLWSCSVAFPLVWILPLTFPIK